MTTLNEPTWQIITHNRANSRDNFWHLRAVTLQTIYPQNSSIHLPYRLFSVSIPSFSCNISHGLIFFCYRQNIYRIETKNPENFQLLGLFDVVQTTATHTHTLIANSLTQIQETENEHKSVYGNVFECVLSVPHTLLTHSKSDIAIFETVFPSYAHKNTIAHTEQNDSAHSAWWTKRAQTSTIHKYTRTHTNTHKTVENESSKSTLYIC